MEGNCDLEIYIDINGYEGKYQISNYGNVRSLDRCIDYFKNNKTFKRKVKGINLKTTPNNRGYPAIELESNPYTCHRLVASHFLENKENLNIINHIDGDKSNNYYLNLEYVSQQENICHFRKTVNNNLTLIGVDFNKNANKWKSRIHINNKSIHLGYFNTQEEAYNARIDYMKKHNIKNKYL